MFINLFYSGIFTIIRKRLAPFSWSSFFSKEGWNVYKFILQTPWPGFSHLVAGCVETRWWFRLLNPGHESSASLSISGFSPEALFEEVGTPVKRGSDSLIC